jgi:hypothetical protein
MEENSGTDEGPSNGSATRPSLAERLMNPPPRPASDLVETGAEPAEPPAGPRQPAGVHPPSALRESEPSFSLAATPALQALHEARRMIRLRYFAFVASMTILFITLVVAVITLAVFLLDGGAWEEKAGSGAIAGGALLLLILLQYRPVAGYATAATELTQLEILTAHLQRSYALWDTFLEDKGRTRQVGANDVAVAVSSMTAATRDLVMLQTEVLRSRRGVSGSAPSTQLGVFPTPTSPDPRRY